MDSGIFLRHERETRSDQQAIQILTRLSRAVFAECPIVLPLRVRIGQWLRVKAVGVFRLARIGGTSRLD